MGLKDRLRGKRTPEDAFADELSRLVNQLLPVQKVERGDDVSLKREVAVDPAAEVCGTT